MGTLRTMLTLGTVIGVSVLGVSEVAAQRTQDVTVVGPADGKQVNAGSRGQKFLVRVLRPANEKPDKANRPTNYGVFMRASRSRRANPKTGLIGADAFIGEMEFLRPAKGARARFRTNPDPNKTFEFDSYWLNKRGSTWYWQAYIVYCERGAKSCYRPGPVRRLRVR